MTDQSPTPLALDAAAVKALAHPLRSRLLARLRMEGPATATELAAALGTNSGATSYHLRRLADVGVVRDTGRGEGKRRLWEASSRGHSVRTSDLAGDEDATVALDWLQRHYVRGTTERFEAWLDHAESWPLAWRDQLGYNDDRVTVTPDELAELHAEVAAVIDRFRGRSASHDDARSVHLTLLFAPIEPAYEAE